MYLLNDFFTCPDTKIRPHTKDMVLHVHRDNCYLSMLRIRSRDCGYFFLLDSQTRPVKARLNYHISFMLYFDKNYSFRSGNKKKPKLSLICKKSRVCCVLEFLKHLQTDVSTKSNNKTSAGIDNSNIKQNTLM